MKARVTRVVGTAAAATLVLFFMPFAGAANAAVASNSDGTTGIRPGGLYNPSAPNGGSQRVPVFAANGDQASVGTFQVSTPNRWNTGDQLRVVLSAGVAFGKLYSVDVRWPTMQTLILADPRPEVVCQAGLREPTLTYELDPTKPDAAVITFTNDSAPVADPDLRFVITIGASVIVSPGTKQGALTATVYGVDAAGSGAAVPLNAVTTLAYVTNIDLEFSFLPHVLIAGAGPQPMAPIRLTETAPGALVDGRYAISFSAGPYSIDSGAATTPVPVSLPDPAGSRFDVQVSGDATLTPGSATASGNTLILPVTSLSPTGALEPFGISRLRLDPPPGAERITVTLTKISDSQDPSAPSPSTTELTFVPVNTPNAGNARAAGPNDLLTPRSANVSRVPAEVGLTPQASIGLLAQNGRIGGNNRYQTAAQVAQQLGAGGKDISGFVIASGEPGTNGVDALSANFLAGVLAKQQGGPVPVLLTKRGELPEVTAVRINNLLNARKDTSVSPSVYVVGGKGAVSPAVFDDLDQVLRDSVSGPGYSLQRVAGADRYSTAAAAAGVAGGSSVGAYAAARGQAPARTAFLSNGLTPVDALSAGPVAYRSHFPVLLTRRDSVPATTLAALTRDGITNVLLLGGIASVGDGVVAQLERLGLTANRLAGADRYGTNTALYRFAAAPVGGTAADPRGGLGYPEPTTPLLTIGDVFADALSAGPLAAEGTKTNPIGKAVAAGSPLLMASWYGVPPSTRDYLNENRGSMSEVTPLGLDGGLPDSVVSQAKAAAGIG